MLARGIGGAQRTPGRRAASGQDIPARPAAANLCSGPARPTGAGAGAQSRMSDGRPDDGGLACAAVSLPKVDARKILYLPDAGPRGAPLQADTDGDAVRWSTRQQSRSLPPSQLPVTPDPDVGTPERPRPHSDTARATPTLPERPPAAPVAEPASIQPRPLTASPGRLEPRHLDLSTPPASPSDSSPSRPPPYRRPIVAALSSPPYRRRRIATVPSSPSYRPSSLPDRSASPPPSRPFPLVVGSPPPLPRPAWPLDSSGHRRNASDALAVVLIKHQSARRPPPPNDEMPPSRQPRGEPTPLSRTVTECSWFVPRLAGLRWRPTQTRRGLVRVERALVPTPTRERNVVRVPCPTKRHASREPVKPSGSALVSRPRHTPEGGRATRGSVCGEQDKASDPEAGAATHAHPTPSSTSTASLASLRPVQSRAGAMGQRPALHSNGHLHFLCLSLSRPLASEKAREALWAVSRAEPRHMWAPAPSRHALSAAVGETPEKKKKKTPRPVCRPRGSACLKQKSYPPLLSSSSLPLITTRQHGKRQLSTAPRKHIILGHPRGPAVRHVAIDIFVDRSEVGLLLAPFIVCRICSRHRLVVSWNPILAQGGRQSCPALSMLPPEPCNAGMTHARG
ncbi:hypothetical protein CDD83_10639 [Cordyceps sp. RAO-2017]|nr:hypothetical protein CDD83_10639 [Cordyceps sp. RAO-2017]